ncbi:hypothetical protein AXQ43_23565 [Salmonella enterica subsp. enterica]|nr:hypothetical protein [Salmonella enterica subsp. enterica serovar Miami]ECH8883512.1 hypothetical protein [Salmonella enterica subsp. enterica]
MEKTDRIPEGGIRMNDERTHRYEYDNTSKENPSLPLRPAWTAAGAGYPGQHGGVRSTMNGETCRVRKILSTWSR